MPKNVLVLPSAIGERTASWSQHDCMDCGGFPCVYPP